MTGITTAVRWMLDASTFIHTVIVKKVRVLVALKSPLVVPMYVFQQEIAGPRAHDETREMAEQCQRRGDIKIEALSLSDLQRIVSLNAPRRKIGLGELACAIIAERSAGGVLCDDHLAVGWLKLNVSVSKWESIEDVLIAAAHGLHLNEYDLVECQQNLSTAKYQCRVQLRDTFLMQQVGRR